MKINWSYHQIEEVSIFEYLRSFYLSKKKVQSLFLEKKVLINQMIAEESSLLHDKDLITLIQDANHMEERAMSTSFQLDILYEDDFILVVNKPKNMIIYDLDHLDTITLDFLVYHYEMLHYGESTSIHVHRLDKDTSGIVIYAKNAIAHSFLSEIWNTRSVQKTYIALVEGSLSSPQGLIKQPIGRDRHRNNHYLVHRSGKEAMTKYTVLSTSGNYSLVQLELLSGRTHQIRVHLSYLGCPIVGDNEYGSRTQSDLMLHASTLEFIHPLSRQPQKITAEMPEEMKVFIKKRGFYEY